MKPQGVPAASLARANTMARKPKATLRLVLSTEDGLGPITVGMDAALGEDRDDRTRDALVEVEERLSALKTFPPLLRRAMARRGEDLLYAFLELTGPIRHLDLDDVFDGLDQQAGLDRDRRCRLLGADCW